MSTEKQIAANRRNGPKANGPNDTEKSRYNARTHGLLSKGLTELDDVEDHERILADLIKQKKPVGEVEKQLLASAALDLVRAKRAAFLEAQAITGTLNPPVYEKDENDLSSIFRGRVLDPGLPAALGVGNAQYLLLFQRYESIFLTRFFRTIHEFERMQRTRLGEQLPAPTAIDITIHADTETVNPTPPGPKNAFVPPTGVENLPSLVDVVSVDPVTVEATPAKSPSQGPASADVENLALPSSSQTANHKPAETDRDALWQKRPPTPIWGKKN